jgi:hypothetical protein
MHVWGYLAEAKIYNPYEKKLDLKTISGYFIGYPEKSRRYRFHYPTLSLKIVETSNSRFPWEWGNECEWQPQNVGIQEVRVHAPLPITSKEVVVPTIVESFDNVEQVNDQPLHDEIITN